MNNFLVSPFKKEDAPSLYKIFFETIREVNLGDYTQEQVQAWAPDNIDKTLWSESFNNKHVYVIRENDMALGFCELKKDGYIDRFYIAKTHINCGLGRMLYCELEKKAHELNLNELYVDASITAKPFFEKFDFTVQRKQTIERKGVELTNYRMMKALGDIVVT